MPADQSSHAAEQALNLLIHDLRAPLSVAQGYLRLLQQNRLEGDADRQRALQQSIDALGRMSRLCDDAAAFMAEPVATDTPRTVVPVSTLVEQVSTACSTRGSALEFDVEQKLSGVVRVSDVDRVVHSLAVILCAVKRSARIDAMRVSVHEDGKEARFLLGADDERAALASGQQTAFDPWRGGHGIALPLACRTVTHGGGRIWTCAGGRAAVGIAIPEEDSVP